MKKRVLPGLYIALILLFLYLPIIVVIAYSFDSNPQASSAKFDSFTFKWYTELVHNKHMMGSIKNSLIIGLWSVAAALVIGTPAAIVTVKYHFRTKLLFDNLTFMPLMIPEIILGIAFLTWYAMLGIPFGHGTMILAHTTFCIPYVIIMVKTRLAGFDKSLEEASRDLGATNAQTFRHIILPAIIPALLSAALLGFAISLDDVIISFFTAGPASNTLPLQIYSMLRLKPLRTINALCTLTVLLAFFTAFLLQLSMRIKFRLPGFLKPRHIL